MSPFESETTIVNAPPQTFVGIVRANVPSLKTLTVLFKLRIVVLLLVAAMGGAFLAANGMPGIGALSLLLVTGGFAAAGSSALNQYFERDSDRLMKRTSKRPLVDGTIARPGWVPYVAGAMILVPSLAVLPFNPALTFFLLLGAAIYVFLYTLYLKPRTLLNIVIGGAAGSAAVLSGSAAVGIGVTLGQWCWHFCSFYGHQPTFGAWQLHTKTITPAAIHRCCRYKRLRGQRHGG